MEFRASGYVLDRAYEAGHIAIESNGVVLLSVHGNSDGTMPAGSREFINRIMQNFDLTTDDIVIQCCYPAQVSKNFPGIEFFAPDCNEEVYFDGRFIDEKTGKVEFTLSTEYINDYKGEK